jgi:hypothetical protein
VSNPVTFKVYSPLAPPSAGPYQPASQATFDVFANTGVFADNTYQEPSNLGLSTLLGAVENQIVSAMNRGVALHAYADWSDPTKFYTAGTTANWYAAYLHQSSVSLDGLAYGYPYDDQGNNSTDISISSPTQLTLTLGWQTSLKPTTQPVPDRAAAKHHHGG